MNVYTVKISNHNGDKVVTREVQALANNHAGARASVKPQLKYGDTITSTELKEK